MRQRHYREGGLAGASSPLSFGGDPINNQTNRPQMKLEGTDGNIFSILGKATQLLRENGQPEQAAEMARRVFQSRSYEKALAIVSEYVETELTPHITHSIRKNRGEER